MLETKIKNKFEDLYISFLKFILEKNNFNNFYYINNFFNNLYFSKSFKRTISERGQRSFFML